MKRKLSFLMTLVIALCTSSAWAQSVISVGTNLDFSEGTPVDNGICTYAKDIADNGTTYSQMLEVTGWTIEGENGDARAAGLFAYGSGYWLGSKENIAPATNPEGAAEGNALGVVAVWDAVAQYVQPVTLEAGNYVINIPVYNSVGGTTAPAKSLIGFIADNGTEYLAPAKAYAVNAWTVETITFTLAETTTGKLSLGYDAPNSGSGANQHLFFDKVEILYEDLSADDIRGVLDAALVTAQTTVDAKAGVGAGLFMYSEEVYNTYAAAVAAAKAVSENAEATADDLKAAIAALNAATEAYVVTAPAADAVYALKFNGTENYLTIGESNITIEATADALSFEAVGNGKYYIHDKEGKYLSYAGNNKWTMSASADVKDEWTVSVNAEGLYTLTGKNGGLGVDGTEAGASCYGDKNGAAVALWAIAEIVIEEEPVVPEVPELIVWTINPADYTAGVQYAVDEAHVVNDTLTIYTTQMHWTTQLRVYSSSEHNGYFYSNKLPAAIKSIEFTAGNKVDVLVVYGSNDGATWTEAAKVEVSSTSYTSGLVADLTGTAYNYFKVDVEGNQQIRISNLIITLDPSVELPKVVAAPSFSLNGCNLFAPATVELTAAEGTIYWSTDNENFVAYTDAIAIDATCTIYAYAEVDGSKSAVASAEYVMATTYDNVAALLAAEATSAGVPVFVKLEATVDSLAKNSAFLVEGTDTLMIYDYNIPADYVVGNVVKGQLAGLWKDYKGTLELCNVDYSGATASTPTTPEAEEFMAAAMALASLTETMPSIWTIPAVSEKFMTVQEKAFGMVDTLNLVPVDTLVYYTALMNETAAFAQAMDAGFNEWKALLFTCYDYQDNSTADEAARAAFDELVNTHMGYQWSMPAATVAELEALIAELDDARIAYALVATANDGFDFGLPTVESPWVGAAVADGMSAYLYNASAKAFLGAGNSWGTQASFNDGIEWAVAGAEKLYTFSGTVSNGGEKHYFTGTYTDGDATQVTVKPVGKGIYTLQVGGAYVAYDGTNIVANVAEVSEACYWQFVTKEERQSKYATASVLDPASATFEISGANFGRNDGANSAWIGDPALGGENTNFCAEKWNAGIVTVSQVVRNMPAGVYRLSAQGFYRMGNMGPAAEARTNGTEILHAKFFANGDSIPVMSVLDCAGMLEGVGNSGYTGYGLAPNSMGEASKFFSAGLYEHSFMFTLAEGVDTINLGVTKTGSVGEDWLIFDNFRLEYLGAKNDVDYLGNGTLTSVSEGNHYVFYTDAEGGNHFLYAAGDNNWVVLDKPVTIAFSAGNITDGFAGAASFMNSNGYYMSNAANSDGSGAIKTEAVDGKNGLNKRTWESQVFYKNAAGKYAIRLTNATGTSWGANCFVNIDPATLAVASGQPSLGDALYLWEIADEDDPRFSTQVLLALIEQAEALEGAYNKDVKAALTAVVEKAKVATAAEVQAIKAELEEAIAAAKASIADYKAIATQLAIAKSVLAETAVGYDVFAAVVAEVDAAYTEATATGEVLPVLNEGLVAYLAGNEVEGLVNGTFGDASAASTEGWTQVGGEMGKTGNHNKWTNVNDGFFEQWKNTLPDVEIYQEISGLPAGTYTFAAYVVACQQNNPDSHEVTGVTLYANAEATPVHTINVDRNETNKAIGAELVLVTTTIAKDETLKVGMKVASTDANWVVMDNAKLYCFDKPAVTPDSILYGPQRAAFVEKAQEFAAYVESNAALTMMYGIKGTYAWPLFDVVDPLVATINEVTDMELLDSLSKEMDAAVVEMEKAVVAYGEFNKVSELFWFAADNSTAFTQEVADARDMALMNSNYTAQMAATVEELEAATVELKNAYLSYISNAWGNQEGVTFDVTFMAGLTPRAGDSYDAATDAWSASSTSANAPEVTTADGRTAPMIEYNTRVGKEKLNSVVMQQTVWNLPNGTYNVELYANALNNNYEVPLTDGDNTLVYVSANDVKTPVVAKNATAITESEVYAINGAVVTDGSLHLTLSKNDKDGTNWHTVQVKSISLVAPVKPVEAPELSPIAVAPEAGKELEELAELLLAYDAEVMLNEACEETIKVTDVNGTVVAEAAAANCEVDENEVTVTFAEAIKLNGTFTVTVPAGMFLLNGEFESAAVELTYTIVNGIENIEAAEDAVIYTVTGKRIEGGVKSLEKGVYIINGAKVLVK